MNLFELTSNNKLTIQPEAYALVPFKNVWEKSKDKGLSEKELAYVYYMVDYKSPFSSIVSAEARHKQVIGALGLDAKWKVDEVVQKAMMFYDEIQATPSLSLLRAALMQVENLKTFFTTYNLAESEKQVDDAKKITETLKSIDGVVKSLKNTEEEVKKEQAMSKVARGGKQIGMFE